MSVSSCPVLGPSSIRPLQFSYIATRRRLIFRRLLSLLFAYVLLLQMVPHAAAPSRQFLNPSSAKLASLGGHYTFDSLIAETGAGAWTEVISAMAGGVEVLPATLTDAVVSRHKPTLNSGRIEGSLRVLMGESFAINATHITSDLYLPGTPLIQMSGAAQHGETISDGGATLPSNYVVSLTGGTNLPGHIHTNVDAIELPADFPASIAASTGSRSVTVASQSDVAAIGNWQTVRDLNVKGAHLSLDVPPGNYRTFTVNGNSQLNLTSGTYNFSNTFNLDGSARIKATGPVTINVGQNLILNSGAVVLGSYTSPGDLHLNVLGSLVNVNGSSQVSGLIRAYNGAVTLNGSSQVRGQVIANSLTLNGGKIIGAVWPAQSSNGLTVFGPRRFDRTTGPPNQYLEQFALPAGVMEPYTLHIQNGDLDGSGRISAASVKMNGASLLAQNDLNQNVGIVDRTIGLMANNQLDIRLESEPGSYLIISITGTVPSVDNTAPTISITSPADRSTTIATQTTVSGTASDVGSGASGVAHVFLNNSEAVYNSNDGMWTITNVALVLGDNQLNARVVDQAGNEASASITITRETPTNQLPTVSAGLDQTLTFPQAAALQGTAVDDGLPEQGSLTTTWTMVSGPGTVTFAVQGALNTTAAFSATGTYVLRLTADDGELSCSDDLTIIVKPANQPPTVSAGPDQTLALPHSATLNGTVTDDGLPDSGALSLEWSQVGGPGTVVFEDAGLAETSASFNLAGTYVLRLTANDTELTSTSDVTINVQPENHAPTVDAGSDQIISLPDVAQLNGAAVDDALPVASVLSVSWSVISGSGEVSFDNPNAPITIARFASAGIYVMRLTASDGELSSVDELRITVTPPNQAPSVEAGLDQTIFLPANTADLNGAISDDGLPLGSGLLTHWIKVSGPGEVTFANPNATVTTASFSEAGSYILRLVATDSQLTSSDDVHVNVKPPNEAPTVNAGADQTINLPWIVNLQGTVSDDGLPAGRALTITWSTVSGPASVSFANPQLYGTTASFPQAGTYILRLTVSDSEFTRFDDITIEVDTKFCATLPPGLIAWWAGENNANDMTAGHHGLLRGGATFADAVVNRGFKLDGVDDYIEISDSADLKPANVTVDAWVKFDGLNSQVISASQGQQYIVFKKNTRSGAFEGYTLYKFRQNGLDRFGFAVASSAGVQASVSSQTNVVAGQFYHVAGSYDRSHVKLYVNGVLESEQPASFALDYGNRPVFLGTTGETNWDGKLNGVIDEADIFNRALNASEIQEIYVAGSAGKCIGPVNHPPRVNAGADQVANLGASTNLQGYITDDGLPGSTVTASWSKVSGPGNVVFSNSVAAATSATFDALGVYVLRLTANDTQLSAVDEVQVTVIPENHAPSANAGPDQEITLLSNASLDGSVSDDGLPVGSTLTSYWSKVSGPGTVIFADPSVTMTTATFGAPGSYVLRLSASDSQLTASDELNVTVAPVCAEVQAGLVGWWPSEGSAVDLVSGQSGQLKGGATYTSAVINQGFKFDGIDDFVEVADSPELRTATVTVETWVRFDNLNSQVINAPQGFQYLVFKKNTRTAQFEGYTLLKLRQNGVDKLVFAVSSAAGNQASAVSQTNVQAGQFYHVAGTYDGSQVRIYVNGVLESQTPASFPLDYGNRPLFLGSTGETVWDGRLNGVIDETAIFNRALSPSEIFNIYQAGNKGKCPLPINGAPTVDAGPDLITSIDAGLELHGTIVDDGLPAGRTVTVCWSKVSGPGTVAFSDSSQPTTNAAFSAIGAYVLRLTANDSQLSSSDEINITVTEPPYAVAATPLLVLTGNSITVNWHAPAGRPLHDRIALFKRGDPNNSYIQYQYTQGAQTGTMTFLAPSVPDEYEFRYLLANENTSTATSTFITVVANLNGETLILDPPSAGPNVTNTSQSLRAVFKNSFGRPISNFNVNFVVIGPNARSFTAVTDSTGVATFSYIGNQDGTDIVQATVSLGEYRLGSNDSTINWVTPVQAISTTTVLGRFFPNSNTLGVFTTQPDETPLFSQNFPSISFNPPTNTILNNTSNVNESTRPFTNVTTDLNGRFTGTIVAQGNGVQAGVGALFNFSAVFTGKLTVASAGDITFNFFSDDGFIFGVGNGASRVSGVLSNPPASGITPFEQLPVMGAYNLGTAPVANSITVHFPSAGTYAYEVDYTECCAGELAITMTTAASGNHAIPPTGSLGLSPNSVTPKNTGQQQTFNVNAVDASGEPLRNFPLKLTVAGANTVQLQQTTDQTGHAAFTYTGVNPGTDSLQATTPIGNTIAYSNVVTLQWLQAPNQAPVVDAGSDQTIRLSVSAQLNGSVSDDGLPLGNQLITGWTKVSGPGTVTFLNPNATITAAQFSATGTYVLRLTANDGALNSSDDVTITVIDNVPPPAVEIIAPADGSSVTEPTVITGSVSSGAWLIEYSLASDDNANNRQWTTIATGSGPRTSAALGTLDPTMMLNGLFDLRLSATDSYGQVSRTTHAVVIERNLKVGNFTVSFSDLNLPVAGVPMEVTRTYDTRDKRVGDFGFGWTLGVKNIRLEKARVIGLNWFETRSDEAFPTYCLEAIVSHLVTVTFPDGKVFKFEASTSPRCQRFAPISGGTLTFTPLPGTHGSLEIVGPTEFQVDGSVPGAVNLIGLGSGVDILNSSVFKFTAEDGTEFVIDQRNGLQSIQDTNNNTVTLTVGGIVHSGGKSITFNRDALGRITSIIDPSGNAQTYVYDAAGDLVSYTDNENNTSTYTYDAAHRLLTIRDPRGNQPIRNDYDADGRLISHTDGFGKDITYTHDLPSRTETVTDRLGHSTIFQYDERGNVLTRTDARGGVSTFTYDANDNLLSETNALGKTTTYTYDANDHRISITDPLSNVTRFTYNGLGKMLTTTDPLGHVSTNTYDGAGNLLTTKDALNNVTTFSYSPFDGQRTLTTDALNNSTHYEYANGYLTKETDALGHETTFGYDANGNRTSQKVKRTNAQGQPETITTTYEYDKLNRLLKTLFADGSFTGVEYHSIGQQAATVDQLGHRTEFTYDDMGRLTRTRYPDGTHEETTYDAEGRRLTSKDRAGQTTSFVYDELGRLTKTTFADNTSISTTYDVIGQVLTTTDARGNVTHYEYDNAGRRTKVRNALNQETAFAYDASGNQLSMTDSLGHTTTFEYDLNNRRTRTIYADSSFETLAYDALGRSSFKTDQAGKTTRFVYDALGRLLKVKDALNQETTYEYDEVGRQVSQTDANNHTTRFEYDQLGRRVKRILPGGQFETYAYDGGGNLAGKRDFNGNTTTYTYDVMGRLLSKVPDPSLNQPTISFSYNGFGQRATMSDASGTTLYSYDVRHRLSTRQTPFGTLTYAYNDGGGLLTTRSSNQNGLSVDYSYDSLNRLESVKDNNLSALNGGVTGYSYDAAGDLQGYSYPNGVTSRYTYDPLNRLTTLTVSNIVSPLAGYAYTLGPSGNRTAVTELSGRRVNYIYDDLYRLTGEGIANDPHGINGTVSYAYDAIGNRINRSSSIAPLISQALNYDANDRLTTDVYDANGNTISANGNSYGYDFENRLTSLNGGNVTYVYDGDGNRVAKTVSGVTTNYLIDTNNPSGYAQVVEELQSGTVVKSFTYGHDLISQRIVGGGISFYGYDGHGSVRLLTDTTAAVTDTYDYDAFGNLISRTGSTSNDYLYSGEQFDANLGMYYLRARYMNPTAGRFWSMDSYEGASYDPASLHKYLYTRSNPTNLTDPSGHFSLVDTLNTSVLIGTVSGFTMGLVTNGLEGAFHGAVQGAVMGALVPLTGAGVGTFLLGNAARGVFITGWGVSLGNAGVSGFSFATATSEEERTSAGINLLTSAGFMYFGPKLLQRVNTKIISAEQANIDCAARGYSEPPWSAGLNVTETTLFASAKYVRVYASDHLRGAYVMEASEIQGLNAIQIQQKFALPFLPEKIAIADIPAGTTIRIGVAGPNNFAPNGGGGMQVEIQNPNHPDPPTPPTRFTPKQ